MALSTNALCELADVKTELGITVSTFDSYLERLINLKSDQIEKYIGRKLYWEEDIVEKRQGYGDRYLVLDRNPISGTPVITYNGTTVSTDDYEVHNANAGILFALYNWIWTTGAVGGITADPWPGMERKLYTVTYDAGWVTANQYTLDNTLTRNLPFDLEDACIRMVAARYRSQGKPAGIKREGMLTWSAEYEPSGSSGSESGIPAAITTILDRYRKVIV